MSRDIVWKAGQSARKPKQGASKEYRTWRNMLGRCYNPSVHGYPRYGGRGISVCARWRKNFRAFVNDMGPPPTPDHTIGRIDHDGNYEPGNCRWETWEELGGRGFAAMSPEARQAISRRGGIAAHASGRAHRFTPEEAKVAGRLGGMTKRGLAVSSHLRAGGIDPGGNHNRRVLALARAHRKRIAEADRLLAAADVQIARRERVIERVRRELAT